MGVSRIEMGGGAARRDFRGCTDFFYIAIAILFFLAASLPVNAAPINYGSHVGDTVEYVDVSEDSTTGDSLPLFGAPIFSADSLDFNPVGFDAHATNGSSDSTNSILTFDVYALPGFAIRNMMFEESGDTTLAGLGTASTSTSVTAQGSIDIFEVDGVPVMVPSVPIALSFTPSAGDWNLAADAAGGPFLNVNWTGSLFLDVNQILTQQGVPFTHGATKLSISITNTLDATSETGTETTIAKKDFGGISITINIPEPGTAVLASAAVVAMVMAGSRGRRQLA
jgi:hypothetical protein